MTFMSAALHARRDPVAVSAPGDRVTARPRRIDSRAMKRLFAPLTLGVGATRHLIWYLSYQITGEPREMARTSPDGLASRSGRT